MLHRVVIISFLISIATYACMYSQDHPVSGYWYQMIQSQDADIQKIFSGSNAAIRSQHTSDTSEGGAKMVAFRFQHFWKNRANPVSSKNGSCFSLADKAIDDYYYSKDKYFETSPAFGHEWKYIGRDSSETHCMGIVVSIAVDKTVNGLKTIYAGTNASGLWKTIDGGKNWFNVTDDIGLPGIGVNDVDIDPSNTNTLYICTGVTTFQRGYGVGIWKSTDAGNSWIKIWGNGNSAQLVQSLLIDPDNSDNLFAVINDKIFRSKNAGQDWQQVFDKLYQPYTWKTRRILDAEFRPGSGDTLYIISEGTQQFLNDTVIDYHPELWQCLNAGADSLIWTRIDDTLNWSYTKRASIAVSDAEPDFLYCSFSYHNESRFCLYRYNTADGKWRKKADTIAEDFLLGIDEWRNSLLVSPSDTNVFYAGGFYVSKIVRNSIVQSGSFYSNVFHVDVRDMKIIQGSDPGSGGHQDILFVANDGGISKTIDGGATWESLNGRGLRITQYYDLAVSETKADYYAGGTQDNGIIIHNPDWDKPWNIHFVSDNYSTVIDHSNPDYIYSLMYDYTPGMFVSYDGGLTACQIAGFPSDESVVHGWPLVIDPYHSGTLYTGLRDGYKSTDYANTWEKFSEFTTPPHMLDSSQKIEDLRVFRLDNRVIYIAYSGSFLSTHTNKLFKTTDGGLNWIDVSVHLDFLEYRNITSIDIHPTDHNKVWLSLGGFSNPGTLRAIFTDDSFNTYQDISEGLPNFPVNCIKVNDTPLNEVFLCNDLGVYYRNDTMSRWEKYGIGLPVCIVSDLEIDQRNNKIMISTFGRGLWEVDGMDPSFSILEDEVRKCFNIYPNPSSSVIHIRFSVPGARSSVLIYDLFGQVMDELTILPGQEETQVDISAYPSGIYFAVLNNESGIIVQKKFIKQQ
ncbi:MAG: T9SS type A sorting domain-containing protein [Bacteroidetes bacterium]|nr:T9SS type A sorting domain-containing protein [Bacteroidota bacterium]